jgi:hypothetical protein
MHTNYQQFHAFARVINYTRMTLRTILPGSFAMIESGNFVRLLGYCKLKLIATCILLFFGL